jgi:hypothetical protein
MYDLRRCAKEVLGKTPSFAPIGARGQADRAYRNSDFGKRAFERMRRGLGIENREDADAVASSTQPTGERSDHRLETAHLTGGENVEDRERRRSDLASSPAQAGTLRPIKPAE